MAYTINLQRKAVREKVTQVARTVEEMKKYPTVALLQLSALPDALFQALRKKIAQEGGVVRVLRKPVLVRALASVPKLKAIAEGVDKPYALILTSLSPYALNKFFKQNRKKRAAKAGEKAPFEIMVPAGDTDIPPGPALSELKSAGINVQIKAGKIAVSKDSVVAKPNEIITDLKAKALQKLGILPFETKAQLYLAFDGSYSYSAELLDIDETLLQDLSNSLMQGTNVALNASYPTAQTVPLLLTQAIRQAVDLSLNASVYNSTSIAILLSSAVLQAKGIEGLGAGTAEEKK